MGANHSHRALRVHTSGPVTRTLLVGLLLAAMATIAGLVVLWPSADRPSSPYAAEGVTYPRAEVLAIGEPCPVVTPGTGGDYPEACDVVTVRLLDDPGDRVHGDGAPGHGDRLAGAWVTAPCWRPSRRRGAPSTPGWEWTGPCRSR